MAAEALQARLVEAETPPPSPITAADIDAALYADLDDNQRLLKFKDIEAEALLDRYNLALAQAALYRARELRIHLTNDAPGRYRQLFRTLKFHRLMHRVRRNERLGGWDMTVDGPISLLKSTSKYGLQMAMFLPALLLCEGWSMEADLAWGPKREPRLFKLDDDCGLRSHYRVQGVYITDEQRHFEERFAKMKTPWTISHDTELFNLGGKDILAPDLVFKNKDDGRVAMLELVGFWRKGWLKGKTDILAKHGPPNLILAVSDRLRTDGGKTLDELPVAVFPFKGVLLPKKLLALIEDVAQ